MKTALAEQVAEAAKSAMESVSGTGPTEGNPSSQPDTTASSTVSAVELPAHLKGKINEATFAKLPVEQQKELVELGDSLYKDTQKKLQDIAPLRKFQNELNEDPQKAEFLKSAMQAYAKGENPFDTAKEVKVAQKETKDMFAELKAHEDPAVRAQAADLESSILNMIKNGAASKDEVAQMRSELAQLRANNKVSFNSTVKEELTKFGTPWSPLIEKYEDDIISYKAKYPDIPLKKIMALISDEEEYATAIRAESTTELKKETERAKASATSKPSEATGGAEGLIKESDIQKSKSARHGDRVRWRGPISRMLPDIIQKARTEA